MWFKKKQKPKQLSAEEAQKKYRKRLDLIIRERLQDVINDPFFVHLPVTECVCNALLSKDQLSYESEDILNLKKGLLELTESGLYLPTTKPYIRALALFSKNDLEWHAIQEEGPNEPEKIIP